jgi:hypothetical protein
MLQHVTVERIQRGIVDVRSQYAFPQVIEHHHTRRAREPPKSLFMQLSPGLRTGTKHQQANRFAAVAQRHHKQPRAAILASNGIADHGPSAIVNLAFFTWGGFDYRARFRRVIESQLADEALDALVTAGEAAGVHQVLPDRHGIAATR